MSSDWDVIRDRLAALRRQEQIEAAWNQHRQHEWIPLSDLGKPRAIGHGKSASGEYLH